MTLLNTSNSTMKVKEKQVNPAVCGNSLEWWRTMLCRMDDTQLEIFSKYLNLPAERRENICKFIDSQL